MSRSNPTSEIVNPSVRWFDFSGKEGVIKYYDKEEKVNKKVPLPFTFIVLDTLAAIKGWNDASDSGISSNEIRDITKDILLVKSFKGPQIAQGFYKDIKDKVVANGGHYVSSIYIAFKDKDVFYIGNIQFKGASLNAWVEFSKANRGQIMKQAIIINGYTEGKKGAVVFKSPTFALKAISDSTQEVANDLDKELQAYFDVYLTRKKVEEQIADAEEIPSDVDHTDDGKEWKPIEFNATGLSHEELDDLPF